jgi:hypothetical protein
VGTATLTISVHVLFFGFSTGISMSEQFAGSGPTTHANALSRRSDSADHRAARQAAAKAVLGAKPDINPPPFTADPTEPNTFGGSMTSDQWAAYCASFAVVAAA